MDTLIYALNAVLPLLLLIGLGYYLSRIKFLSEEFLVQANRFVFRIALPAMLFCSVYSASGLGDIRWNVVLYAIIGVAVLFLLGMAIVILFVPDCRKKGVILQGFFRSNMIIIGAPLAEALGGEEAMLVVALVSMVIVPLYNVLAVVALSMFQKDGEGHPIHWAKTLSKIALNPLIIAIALGVLTLVVREFVPVSEETGLPVFTLQTSIPFLYTGVKWISQIASPMALIVLGGGFRFAAVKSLKNDIILGVFLRNLIAPVVALAIAVILVSLTPFFTFQTADYPALIATFAAPVAVTSTIMAKEMNNDEQLAGQIVVWSSLLSIISIFLIVIVFREFGML